MRLAMTGQAHSLRTTTTFRHSSAVIRKKRKKNKTLIILFEFSPTFTSAPPPSLPSFLLSLLPSFLPSFLTRKEDLEDICRLVSKILYTLCLDVRPFLCLNYMGGGGLEEDWGGLEKDWRRVGEGLEKDRRRIGEGLEKDWRRTADAIVLCKEKIY